MSASLRGRCVEQHSQSSGKGPLLWWDRRGTGPAHQHGEHGDQWHQGAGAEGPSGRLSTACARCPHVHVIAFGVEPSCAPPLPGRCVGLPEPRFCGALAGGRRYLRVPSLLEARPVLRNSPQAGCSPRVLHMLLDAALPFLSPEYLVPEVPVSSGMCRAGSVCGAGEGRGEVPVWCEQKRREQRVPASFSLCK